MKKSQAEQKYSATGNTQLKLMKENIFITFPEKLHIIGSPCGGAASFSAGSEQTTCCKE